MELSTTGAHITTDDPKALPKVCEIWIPHLDLSIKASVRWRKNHFRFMTLSRQTDTGKKLALSSAFGQADLPLPGQSHPADKRTPHAANCGR